MTATTEAQRSLRTRASEGANGAGLVVSGSIAVTCLVFVLALREQLWRLHAPLGEKRFDYGALHGDHVADAFEVWSAAAIELRAFDPLDAVALVRVHIAADAGFAIALGAFLILLVRRLGMPPLLTVIAGLGAFADIVEGLLELALTYPHADDRYVTAFVILGGVRFGCPALVVVGVAILLSTNKRREQRRVAWEEIWRAPATPKLMVGVALVAAALPHAGSIGAQVEDLLRRELELRSHGEALLRLGLAIVGYFFVVVIVHGIQPPPGKVPTRGPVVKGGAAAFAAGALVVATGLAGGGSALACIGLVAVLYGVFRAPNSAAIEPDYRSGAWMYAVAAVVPAASVVALSGRLLAAEVATRGAWRPLAVFSVALLMLTIAAGWRLRAYTPERGVEPSKVGIVVLALVAAAPVAVALVTFHQHAAASTIGHGFSTIGVLFMGLAAFAAAGGLARALASRNPANQVGLARHRTPVGITLVSALVLTLFLGAQFEQSHASRHVVRDKARLADPRPDCPGEVAGSLSQAFCQWITANADRDDVDGLPLVLVSASGGGVRAATWTARVVDCVFLPPPHQPNGGTDACGDARLSAAGDDHWPTLFAVGGASGGSVGIASAVAHRIAPMPDTGPSGDWVRALAGPDHVARLFGQSVFGELPLAVMGMSPSHDRAEALIDSWSRPFGKVSAGRCGELRGRDIHNVGFLEARDHCPGQVPLLLLNGTTARTGARLNVSPIDSPPPTLDLHDVLCEQRDVPLLSAAFLSARFPFVSPSGRFTGRCDDGSPPVALDVLDGGIRENSGTAQVAELWPELDRLIDSHNATAPAGSRVRPIFVRIENGEIDHASRSGGGARPDALPVIGSVLRRLDLGGDGPHASSLGEPLRFFEASHSDDAARSTRRLVRALCDDQVPTFHFALYAHPGGRLPLGWALTEAILDDVNAVFRLGPNRKALDGLRVELAGGRPDAGDVPGCPAR